MKHIWKKRIKNFLGMTIGAATYAAAISLIVDPNSLAPGGVAGIAVLLNRLIHIETGTLILLLNIPILMLGIWKFGFRFIITTIYCIFVISGMTNLLGECQAITNDMFLAAIFGGALMAVGIGLVFKSGATSGGTDIIVKVLRLRFPHLKTGVLFLGIDAVIVACSVFVFKDIDTALYAGLTVIICSTVLDIVLYGRDEAKLIYIISDKYDEITQKLLEDLDIGVTHVRGVGAYSGKEKNVIMCVVKKHVAPKVEDVIKQEDHLAFMIVTSATEIFGEGYKNLLAERL